MSHACDYQQWIRRASDVELSRAVVEEGAAFLPEALDAIRIEVRRRRLRPEEVVQRYRAWRGRSAGGGMRRYLFGGLLVAGLGIVPGLLPRLTQLRVLVLLDNPSDDEMLFEVQGRRIAVEPGEIQEMRVKIALEEAPLAAIVRGFLRRDDETGDATLTIGVRRRGSREGLRQRVFGVVDGGRYLAGADPAVAYAVLEQSYRVEGRHARREGRPRRAAWSAPGTILDLGVLEAPGGEEPTWVSGSFPPVLELPEPTPERPLLTRYGLRRE